MSSRVESLATVVEGRLHFNLSESLCVADIVHRDLLQCLPTLPVSEAARLMSEHKISSIVVANGKGPLGIWTERDALAIDFGDEHSHARPIADVMSSPARSVPATMSLQALTRRFRDEKMRHYLVTGDDEEVIGIVSLSDVVLNQGLEHYLRLRKVDSLVKSGLQILPAGAPLAAASTTMLESGRDAVIIDFAAEDGQAGSGRYGIVTERDLMRSLATRHGNCAVGRIASRPLVTVDERHSLFRARCMMAERGIRHIGVADEEGELIDVISFSDLLNGMELSYVEELQQALHEADQALSHSRRELHLAERIIEASLEAIMVTDLQGKIVSVNPAFTRLTGYGAEEVLGRNPSLLASGHHGKKFYEEMWQTLEREGSWRGEIWNRRKSGEIFPELLHITAIHEPGGAHTHYAAQFIDISELKETEARIRNLAYYDALTGLPNRRLLEDRLAVELSHAWRNPGGIAVLFIDLDRFKRINDSLGHEIGDQVLVEVARRISDCLREEDTVGRMGGDEFIVILGQLNRPEDAATTARRILAALRPPVIIDGRELIVTTSIGISIYPDDSLDATTLVKNADIAMYRAKEEGRNSFQLYQPEMNSRSLERLALETALHGALARDELVLHFQPLVNIESGELLALEALVRWQHPELGLISPADFIHLAEETGLIVPMGKWVLQHACSHYREWLASARQPVRMKVNISARQFRESDFVASVAQILETTAMPPSQLTLELNESTLLEDVDAAMNRMRQLGELGVGLALDDFGTGYSSFACLKEFPVDELKVDRVFVRGIDRNERDAALVSGIIHLARSLGLRVVAEGVETSSQAELLRQQGCELAQGFYFSEPKPWEGILAAH